MPRALLIVGGAALIAAVVSIAVGEGGPQAQDIGGVNEVQRIFGGIAQEGADLGPEDAELAISVFNDIQCEPCADYEIDVIDPLVEGYARTDQARFEFRHFSLAPNDTTLAAIAAEAAGEQARQWQYLDTFVRNQDLAISRDVDEDVLREVAEAVPQLDVEQWQEDFESPRSEELVRQDAMLAAELQLPAEPAVVVSGPGGQRELIESPSTAEIEAAIDAVGQS
ncbi:MAG TPA: thioredoxin domain-containing protein [Solirubrobacterales bacterium]|nr:thioredoxin domain-containing protein [Solirubrobacterales bacterium]